MGLIGVGRIGAFHARTLLGLDGVELAIADADAPRAAQTAAELGVAASAPEALVESRPDALVIATSTPAHAPLLRLAAAAGVPTFCEKPVALDPLVLDAVIDEVEESGVLVQVGFQRRFD
ncbi:MAG: Gfo/Idh/MocA family oxidoreductase, partial [Gaiellaceae bacterium]